MATSTKPVTDAAGLIGSGSLAGRLDRHYKVGNVSLGTQWSYVLGVSGSTISVVFNGGAQKT